MDDDGSSGAPGVSGAEPAGFGNCGVCPLMQHGTVAVCSACALEALDDLPTPRCVICDGNLNDAGVCRNRICTWATGERHFRAVYAVSTNSGELRDAIHRYKYRGRWGWGRVFGRVLAGHMELRPSTFSTFGLMVPSPTFVTPDRSYDHIALMVEEMERESGHQWPVRYDVIAKTRATRKMTDCASWVERAYVARTELRPALQIRDPDAVVDRDILVFDDVFTAGHTLVEVARALRLAGARTVSEIVLARQTWDD